MGRGPEPDDLRAERHRAVVFIVREVMDSGSDRHGRRGLVRGQRPFHNLLRRTIGGAGWAVAAVADRAYKGAGASPTKPQAASASSMWGGAGASTSIGGFDFESGTITLRASNWSGRSARAP